MGCEKALVCVAEKDFLGNVWERGCDCVSKKFNFFFTKI